MPEKSSIAYAKIHPAIGVARLGNSPSESFIGPEVPYIIPRDFGFYRDANGFIKRQAARFRIYGYNAAGELVSEITADQADIRWTVEVANTKAAWYNFDTAMDLPEAVEVPLRNRAFTGEERKKLRIEPGSRTITGKNRKGVQFDTGTFCGLSVYLGELATDDAGRLLVLGGRGRSSSAFGQKTPSSFDNNDGWHDDVSDGPVTAEVMMDGVHIPVEPAWVVTVPPNYAPDLTTFPTMYDVVYDVMLNGGVGWVGYPSQISFMEHIYPIFKTLSTFQWVNFGYFSHYGFGAPFDFEGSALFARLADPSPQNQEFRTLLFQYFRNPAASNSNPLQWPWITGDTWMNPGSAQEALSVTPTQYQFLSQWAAGNFVDDSTEIQHIPKSLDEIPVPLQPAALDKAALYFLSGGPFHPGVDVSWTLRHYTLYDGAFRIKHANGEPEVDFGPTLKPGDVISMFIAGIPIPGNGGPLNSQRPGDLTKWLSIPWQLELVACSPGVLPGADPYLPAFWPTRIPDNVLTKEKLDTIKDGDSTPTQKQQAFTSRARWTRSIQGFWMAQAAEISDAFYRLGIIQQVSGVGVEGFPDTMYVETPPIEGESSTNVLPVSEEEYGKALQKLRKKIRK